MPGCLGPSAKLPRHFSSFRTFSKNFTTHNPKSCNPARGPFLVLSSGKRRRRGTRPQKLATAAVSLGHVSNIGSSRAISNACFKFGRR